MQKEDCKHYYVDEYTHMKYLMCRLSYKQCFEKHRDILAVDTDCERFEFKEVDKEIVIDIPLERRIRNVKRYTL